MGHSLPRAIARHSRSSDPNALAPGSRHGYGIARRNKTMPGDVLELGESSLCPTLQRPLLKGWPKAEWGTSENNRRGRYYTLTARGRRQLTVEHAEIDRFILAIHQVLNAT
jgi:PadR family transcriptional regulator PadR